MLKPHPLQPNHKCLSDSSNRRASSCASASHRLHDAQAPGRSLLPFPSQGFSIPFRTLQKTEPLGPLGAGRSKNLSLTPEISFFALLIKSLVSLTTRPKSTEGCCIPRIYIMSRWPSATNLHLPLIYLPGTPTDPDQS